MHFIEDAANGAKTDWELRYWDAMLEERAQNFLFRKPIPFLEVQSGPEQSYHVQAVPDQVGLAGGSYTYSYESFPSLEITLLQMKWSDEGGGSVQLSEVNTLPRRAHTGRSATGEFDYIQQELVMAKFTLAQTARAKDILWQDMQSLSAQIEKLDLQKAIFEEEVVRLYEEANGGTQKGTEAANTPVGAMNGVMSVSREGECKVIETVGVEEEEETEEEKSFKMSKSMLLGGGPNTLKLTLTM